MTFFSRRKLTALSAFIILAALPFPTLSVLHHGRRLQVADASLTDCVLAMHDADTNEDSFMNQDEYIEFVNDLSSDAYAGESLVTVPEQIRRNYFHLAGDNGQIAISGSRPSDDPSTEQIASLLNICMDTVAAIKVSILAGCFIAMNRADLNGDRMLNRAEYFAFVSILAGGTLEGSSFEELDLTLFQNFFIWKDQDTDEIDIVGSRPGEDADAARMEFLETMCTETEAALIPTPSPTLSIHTAAPMILPPVAAPTDHTTTPAPIPNETPAPTFIAGILLAGIVLAGTVVYLTRTRRGEVGIVGGMWRGVLRRIIIHSYDSINGLQLSRGLQVFLPFLTGYEAYVLAQVIQALDQGNKAEMHRALTSAFQNRNVSRILVQTIGQRYDFVWHWNTQIRYNRAFDAWGQLPVVGITRFPVTENVSSTRDHALASIFRIPLRPGSWIARSVTGREGLVSDDPEAPSQNLAAESNGREEANRNQNGTYAGRRETNNERFSLRLPTDESIVRTFVAQPMSTMVNNGAVHVLRVLAKHWHNILRQSSGNFAHQRMEQLNPFEMLRFHMPVVLLTLSSLRGRNQWDSRTLGPFIMRLQELKPSTSEAWSLLKELKEEIVANVSGGASLIMNPFQSWLDALEDSFEMLEEEATKVDGVVSSVKNGIDLGRDLIARVADCEIPPESQLKSAILRHIRQEAACDGSPAVEAVLEGDEETGVKTEDTEEEVMPPSEGDISECMSLLTPCDKRTLLELVQKGFEDSRPAQLLLGRTKTLLQRQLRRECLNQMLREAKPVVAEQISRAQRAYMNLELDHGKKFSFDAFMEFTSMRDDLRTLIVISQLACEELDNARLNMLAEIKHSNQGRPAGDRPEPQSLIVIGGGPSGMMTLVHCAEAVLMSGGEMKLHEKRESAFERAQIVRLDARFISMLRYHLGTGFEDVFIPASGETDAHLGNTLPSQGFVETTIKDLEGILHSEVLRMRDKGLASVYTGSVVTYDHKKNALTKLGMYLNVGDIIARKVNEECAETNDYHSWRVVEVHCSDSLGPKGTMKDAKVTKLVLESTEKDSNGNCCLDTMSMEGISEEVFTLDTDHTHVVLATGKEHDSEVHFGVTTEEPYGVCCIEGLKILMGMHNFGEKRWGSGLFDDLRSHTDQNTRLVGDFTKLVRTALVVEKMQEYMSDKKDTNWQMHFGRLAEDAGFSALNEFDEIVPRIQKACEQLSLAAPSFQRQTLQTRFFETGDNYYLGMELMREYDKWKKDLAAELVSSLTWKEQDNNMKERVDNLKKTFVHHIDCLWYDAVLEVIRTGDVFNPGGRSLVPRLYLIDSCTDKELGKFPVGESFRLRDSPEEKYEIVIKERSQVIVRNIEGYISKIPKSTMVKREGNLSRGPDRNVKSKVALSTFPVGHYVNHRSCRLNDSEKGYIFAFIGDLQASPHFMRYSGMTGACINAMLFNIFIKEAKQMPFINRLREYSIAVNWSNGEVVLRGAGNNNGEDAFLRPGFSYHDLIEYLHSKVVEYRESAQDLNRESAQDFINHVVPQDWKVKLSASLVPRGMEMNDVFIRALRAQLHLSVFNKFVKEAKADELIDGDKLGYIDAQRDSESFWTDFLHGLDVGLRSKEVLDDSHAFNAKVLDQICTQLIEFATEANERVSSELFNQPKPVDSILDDFAVEAQNFANSLTKSAAFAAGALAFTLVGDRAGGIAGAILAGFNIAISFGTLANSGRYKIRNEAARIMFADETMPGVLKSIFSLMSRNQQHSVCIDKNPFRDDLKQKVSNFEKKADYYDCDKPKKAFLYYCKQLLQQENFNDPEKLREFQNRLVAYIADEFHVNSYLQEDLVSIYRSIDDWYHLVSAQNDQSNRQAMELFNQLTQFCGGLETSLQRGPTRFGFLKKRRCVHWDCTVVLKYFCSPLCHVTGAVLPMAPASVKIWGIVKRAKLVSGSSSSQSLGREIRDLEGFYWATRESETASLIFVTGFIVFVTSILFTFAQIFRIQVLLDIAFWGGLASALGAVLATFHLWRKFWILVKLASTLGSKVRTALSSIDRDNIRKVHRVTRTQIVLTAARFLSAATAAAALPWSIAENMSGERTRAPLWLALASLCTAIISTLFFFFVEYEVRYNLSPKLGEFVCESFREDIQTIMSRQMNDTETKKVQDREMWEYVAREFLHQYRFDTVFAADRFGSIWLYLLGGMNSLDERPPSDCASHDYYNENGDSLV